jgi:hypothetical protein
MFMKYQGSEEAAAKWEFKMDTPQLPAHYAVWLASEEARFLRGKWTWSGWDVGELKAQKEAILNTPFLSLNIIGWPFQAPS